MSTEEQEWDLQAAEYVLGTLSDENQKVFDVLYQVDDDWQRRVHHWQARLSPLNAFTQAVEPPSHVLAAVMARIDETSSLETPGALEIAEAPSVHSTAPGSSNVELHGNSTSFVQEGVVGQIRQKNDNRMRPKSASADSKVWRERARYWKFATVMVAASLIGILVLAPRYLAQRQPVNNSVRTVAVLQNESNTPIWAVAYHANDQRNNAAAGSRGTISVTAVGDPQASAEQDYQLWMVLPEEAGVRSVGLVPDTPGGTVTLELPITLVEAGEFAVSLEAVGGVPGPEHGPVVARTFIITVPE